MLSRTIKAQQKISTSSIRRFTAAAAAAPGIGHMGKFLAGKGALVTGSTSGIGLGIAKTLASHGCNITLNGFGKPEEIEAIKKSIASEYGVKVDFDGADLSKPQEIAAMMTKVNAGLGVDILVNNAGIQHISAAKDFPENMWNKVIDINLNAVFHTTKAALPSMLAKGYGRIINISSVHGLVASVNKSAYVASKHAVMGFTKAVALETAGTGVTVNAVNPGWVLTPLVQAQIDLKAKNLGISVAQASTDLLSEKQPSKEFATPEDLGNLVTFLASPFAKQMTGAAYIMDGGWTAQ